MPANQFEWEDQTLLAKTRQTQQFTEQPVFEKYVTLLIHGFLELQEAFRQVQQERSIDYAVGAQLDVIGEIVGRPRGVVSAEVFEYFGFQNAPLSGTFGSLNDWSIGRPWYSIGAPLTNSRPPTDEEYRLILKAKIIKNRTLSRPEDVIEAYKFLFGATQIFITEPEPCRVNIGIGKILSAVERGLLFDLAGVGPLLPKTAGVQYYYSEFHSDRVFGTEGFPHDRGVGDLYLPETGGYLMNIITSI